MKRLIVRYNYYTDIFQMIYVSRIIKSVSVGT